MPAGTSIPLTVLGGAADPPQSVHLLLHREKVRKIAVVFRDRACFVCTGKTGFGYHADMHFSIATSPARRLGFFPIRLVHHALVAFACGAGLVCVHSGDDEHLVGNFSLHLAEF